ncbi:hypothetical protein AA103196_0526 [Ameyamaea chiangmaiensis NBRC 103196]|uniref:Protein nucleotidyltransferase YdiU n=1 Tax=Ameyamaea chiangmaiensis TaxID=442969 RepID=A0A850PAN0_9PROT|nr:YdiU family protein [Ameyamaea chiangmaiensis]MBS4074922.1 YdiU family protein [Ameyamaea chiangmaiensis]NVN41114.1 YdiU family protein [Ameyamaea chiangmaiensis]GBQ63215.1 hypothetical protein AA103196_0526 [Ameyamaea chiangmaiensis NBRC 103196]
MPVSPTYRPSRAHMDLGSVFYDPVAPADFPQTLLRYRNDRAAATVGLDTLTDEEWRAHFGRFIPLPDSLPQPLALRYHGHQFRVYNPDLGDGRGFLFAQMHDAVTGRLMDLGTKGSGTTPWSRGGDGRLTLKGGVREILATEMLEALGVNTSRTLSVIETGERLARNDEPSPTRACVLVRLGHSHIRIGTFQRLAVLDERAAMDRLVAYVRDTYYPDLAPAPGQSEAAALFGAVCERVATTGAQLMAAGFVHGVLNTDNIAITGESFDYGPWRFLPTYDQSFTAAYFDHAGLYAYGRQPQALGWNLARLAECLLPLGTLQEFQVALESFATTYQKQLNIQYLRRLGLQHQPDADVPEIATPITEFLSRARVGFENFFFDWYGGANSTQRAMNGPRASFYDRADFAPVRALFDAFAGRQPTQAYFERHDPVTMLIDQVEALWSPIAESDDWGPFHATLGNIAGLRAVYGVP